MAIFKNDKIVELEFVPLTIINNTRKLNMTKGEHLKSFIITFLVAFAMVVVANIDTLSTTTFESGAILGLLAGAIRAGVKGVLELFIAIYSSK